MWISQGLPGSTYDLTAAGCHRIIITAAARAGVEPLADWGYQGVGATVTTPYKGRRLTTDQQQQHNRMVNSLRGPGECGFATLKAWRIFTKVRCCPQRVGAMAQAVLALELGSEP